MRAGLVLTILVVTLAAALGFHWISYPTNKGRTICAIPKDHLTFDETVVTGETQVFFAVQHPIFATQIATGKGFCVNR